MITQTNIEPSNMTKAKLCIIKNWPKINRPNFRSKLATKCGLTPATLNNYIAEMRKEGIKLEIKRLKKK